MISEFFIRRPVFASVLSIIIFLTGLMSLTAMPIEQYPNVVPPEVTVAAFYPGASAETIATTIAAPLEQEINGVENMLYMRSTSTASGAFSLSVSFAVGTDPDQATIDVNNRVKAAEIRLPEEVRRQGVRVAKSSSNILEVLTLSSTTERYDSIFVSNYALLNVIDELKRVPGVGGAELFGAQDYSMRIWLRPDKLAEYNLTPADVAAAVQEQNNQFAAGRFGDEPMAEKLAYTYSVTTKGRLVSPEEFGNIILRSNVDGATLRIKDIARVELGSQDYGLVATNNNKPTVPIGIYLQPGANALETSLAVEKRMDELARNFPEGIVHGIPFNTTKFVEVSIKEVVKTFLEAMVLVMLVIYLFLQSSRATVIPLLAVPVSIIGTLAVMLVLGFSVNLLTLFGLVLAIGIVVDDAIIVIENVERIMAEEKLPPREASIKAMHEVTGPIIAIVLVLTAVFLPVAFMGGMTGEMYRQFAMTIAVSVIISGFVALTLTPALCAIMLKPIHKEPLLPFRLFNRAFDKFTVGYVHGVRFFMKRALVGLLICGGMVAIMAGLFARVPSGLVPAEDQGYVIMAYMLPPAASLNRTVDVTSTVSQMISEHPAVSSIVTLAGFDILSGAQKTNGGVSFVPLKDWEERTDPKYDARNIVNEFMGMGMAVKDGFVMAFNPPPIMGLSMTGGFEGYVQDRTGKGYAALMDITTKLVAAAAQRPELANVQTTFTTSTPQYFIDLDREKAQALDVSIDQVYATMQSTFGSLYVNDFTLYGRNFRVSLQSEEEFRRSPDDLRHVFVRSRNGQLIPLDSLIKVDRIIGPDMVERFNVFPAAKIMGDPGPGYSSGQALAAIEEVGREVLGEDYTIGWVGSAYQEKAATGTGAIALGFGIIMVFLILAAQYERWVLPLAVITAVPFAVFGAILAAWLRGLDNDLYFQIGLITLVGLSAKNAILIIEFAMIRIREGVSIFEAASEAARLRMRPIVMTSLAFMMGCVPLAISTGAGSASRHAIGTGVIGGMLAATFIATLFVPMFFKLIAGVSERKRRKPHDADAHS